MDVTSAISPALVASGLREQICGMAAKFEGLMTSDFASDFIKRVNDKRHLLEPAWNERWQDLCNGKLLFEDLRKTGHFKGDLLRLKKEIVGLMRSRETTSFKTLATSFRSLLGAKV